MYTHSVVLQVSVQCPTGRIEWRLWTASSTMTQLMTTLRENHTVCWSRANRREEVSGDPGVRGHSTGPYYVLSQQGVKVRSIAISDWSRRKQLEV